MYSSHAHTDPLDEAIRASRREAGIPDDALHDEDEQLARILEESKREAEARERAALGVDPSGATSSGAAAAAAANTDDNDDLNNNDLGGIYTAIGSADEPSEFEADDWDEGMDLSVAGSAISGQAVTNRADRERVLCPYCTQEFYGMDAMVQHMQHCEMMHDD